MRCSLPVTHQVLISTELHQGGWVLPRGVRTPPLKRSPPSPSYVSSLHPRALPPRYPPVLGPACTSRPQQSKVTPGQSHHLRVGGYFQRESGAIPPHPSYVSSRPCPSYPPVLASAQSQKAFGQSFGKAELQVGVTRKVTLVLHMFQGFPRV